MIGLPSLPVRRPAEGGGLPYAVGACVSTEGISRTRELVSPVWLLSARAIVVFSPPRVSSVTDGGAEFEGHTVCAALTMSAS